MAHRRTAWCLGRRARELDRVVGVRVSQDACWIPRTAETDRFRVWEEVVWDVR